MSSDLDFPTSSPTTVKTLKLSFPKRYQSHEAEETDDESSLNRTDRDPPKSMSQTLQVSFWLKLTSILVSLTLTVLPPAALR